MAKFDLHNHINPKRGISPVAAAQTDNTAIVSQIVDTLGYGSVEFLILTGSLADADATFTVLVEHGDQSNLSDAATPSAGELLGTAALASFTFADDDKVFKIGYVGSKRYVRVTITPANNTGNACVAGVWLLGHAVLQPTSNPPA
ncbi:hypothetical protein [Mesorhizobium sp. M00.F.Ca.ET.217.01.1.1]|uniref:hypothetical protein n=1 Tax=Mesorhizobium sp. M00.F.Ca.ET.217.01.1.1 TaxID=2500529 RepID=UPI000FDBBF23|nr:hypothetical protein [Mesorhizobium sp. M00.F.Ca.ET.217.01.1.1]TGQ19317.1 hypothetical protein EN860_019510 [Mesorhizobium sp. M00.F.Ca.ET.217.01.1.1]TIU12457.1 MAG: hypothetical protein E5W44_07195 [Mesorhizobium sp.]